MDLGDSFMGHRVRYHGDGTFTVARLRDLSLIDKHFTRVPGRERWFIKNDNAWTDITFEGDTANIIGKGPSLDKLRSWHLKKGPSAFPSMLPSSRRTWQQYTTETMRNCLCTILLRLG
jgi:hypothetical protein